jgi:hypothetical protein
MPNKAMELFGDRPACSHSPPAAKLCGVRRAWAGVLTAPRTGLPPAPPAPTLTCPRRALRSELGARGVKSLLAVPISFVSEHIETLEEIDMEYRELAEESGEGLPAP